MSPTMQTGFTSASPAIPFTPKYFLGLSGDYSLSDHDVSSHPSPSPSPAPATLGANGKSKDFPKMKLQGEEVEEKVKVKVIEAGEKEGKMTLNRAARREGKRRAWAEAHSLLPPVTTSQQQPINLSTTTTPTPALKSTDPPQLNLPKAKPTKPNRSHLPLKIQHLLLPLPAPSALSRARKRHRYFTKRHLANVRDLLMGRRMVLPDAPKVDLDEVLRERLRGLLVARKSLLTTPVTSAVDAENENRQADKEDEEDELDAVEEQITFFEKPVPFFKQRARSPTSSNPIIYPRGHIPSPQTTRLHPSAAAAGIATTEVEVEFIKPKFKPLIIAQAMLKKILAHPGCMYGLSEGERKWVRRMAGLGVKVKAEEELERLLRGRQGEVVWEEGVGRVERVDGEGGGGGAEEGNVHVFMDHSNIHLTMLNTVSPRYSSATRHSDTETDSHPTRPFQPFTKKYLSLPLLTLLLTRGRSISPDALHLVASAPLMQNLDQAVRNGWKCAVLQRVEVAKEKGGARKFVRDDLLKKRKMLLEQDKSQNTASDSEHLATSGGETDTGKKHSIKTAKSEDEQEKAVLPTLDDPTITSRRMREQAVDELLQLKMLQTILVTPATKIGTIVLCTGDAAPGQFNDLGFLGCTKLAIERGWRVELWSWKKGLSRLWREEAKSARWSRRQFEIMYLDEWVAEVVEEKAE